MKQVYYVALNSFVFDWKAFIHKKIFVNSKPNVTWLEEKAVSQKQNIYKSLVSYI